mmetsp:Transcript_62515/g.116221  ORF Transcript_62515/g.116221 Transcript_62515/m.116221 type:complete len:338 (+) Transcript_62515:111-1124(+)
MVIKVARALLENDFLGEVDAHEVARDFLDAGPSSHPTSFVSLGSALAGLVSVLLGGPKGPLLGSCKARLIYATKGVRYADIDQNVPCGWKAPKITFTRNFVKVHLHMEDKRTGEVLWDVDLKRSSPGKDLPTRKLSKEEGQSGTMTVYKAPCTDRDDPKPHLIDMSFRTLDGHWNDKEQTEWNHERDEGFANFRGRNEHVGFEVYRLPRISPIPWRYVHKREPLNPINSMEWNQFRRNPLTKHVYREIVGPRFPPRKAWKRARPGIFSKGDRRDLAFERMLYKEEDPYGKYDYYAHIPKRNYFNYDFGRLHRFGPPRVVWSRYGAGDESFTDTSAIL